MKELIKVGSAFVQAMQDRRGIAHVDEIYSKNAESVEAVVPPGRDVRIAKGRGAIKAKRQYWAERHEIHVLDAEGPYIHPPNRFGIRYRAEVTQRNTGERKLLREFALYSVQDGKIVREEFFKLP